MMADLVEALRQLQDTEDAALERVLEDPQRPAEMVTVLSDRQDIVETIIGELELVAMSLDCEFVAIRVPPTADDNRYRMIARARGKSLAVLDYARAVRTITVAYAH
jgi:hypothetical protein